MTGKHLELGIVEAIVGLKYYFVTIKGISNHAGATPMTMRADTVLAMANAVSAGADTALTLGDGTVFTTGMIQTHPGQVILSRIRRYFPLIAEAGT